MNIIQLAQIFEFPQKGSVWNMTNFYYGQKKICIFFEAYAYCFIQKLKYNL